MSGQDEISPQRMARFLALLPLLFLRILAALAFKPNKGKLHWRQLVALRFLQTQRSTLPQDILRWYVRRISTGEGVRAYCAKHGIPHRQVTLDSAATGQHATCTPPGILHILSSSTPESSTRNEAERPAGANKKTILYLHGGGYVNPMRSEAHMPFIMKIMSASRASQVAILEYSLAPEHPYPAQTIQAIAALNHVLNDIAVPAEEIILAGDSAGGQMVGSVLAHIVRPCPYAVPISLPKRAKLGAALMISPLTVLEIKAESYVRSDGQDYLDQQQMGGFKAAWRPTNGEVWADMCEGEGSKEVRDEVFRGGSEGGGGIVKKVMVAVGTAEVFLDCCREFADKFLQVEKTVTVGKQTNLGSIDWDQKDHLYVECEGEVHVQVALDSAVGYERGLMMGAILGWLKSF